MASAMACGSSTVAGVTKKQGDAINAATSKTCDSYERCGEIGAGKTYTNRADCETARKSFWNDRWPVVDCDNRINGSNLQLCLDAIGSTSCSSFLDQLNTVYSKCAKADVCNGG